MMNMNLKTKQKHVGETIINFYLNSLGVLCRLPVTSVVIWRQWG